MSETQNNVALLAATSAAMQAGLLTQYENQFNFRKTKSGFTRPSLSLTYPVATLEGIVDVATNGSEKAKQYILDLTQGAVTSHIKSLVDDDLEFSQETLDKLLAEKAIDLEFLANLPRSERSGATKEDIDNFAEAYRAIMPEVLGAETAEDKKKIDLAADIFQQRLKPVLAKPKMLAKLQGYLGQFAEAVAATEDAETIAAQAKAIDWFTAKFAELLAVNLDEDAI